MDCQFKAYNAVTREEFYKLRNDISELRSKVSIGNSEIKHKIDMQKYDFSIEGVVKWFMIYAILLISIANCRTNADQIPKVRASEMKNTHATP